MLGLLRCQDRFALSHDFSLHLQAAIALRMPARSMSFATLFLISIGETVE
jgi:hypothetical protein